MKVFFGVIIGVLIGASLGSFIGALLIKLICRIFFKFNPRYWNCYLAHILTAVSVAGVNLLTFIVGFAFEGNRDIVRLVGLISTTIGIFLGGLLMGAIILKPDDYPLGLLRGVAVAFLYSLFVIIILLIIGIGVAVGMIRKSG